MSDLPTRMEWLLHITRGHTPTENWNGQGTPVGFNITWHDTADQRWDEEEAHMAECNQLLVKKAPVFREEVIRLREIVKVVEDAVKTHIAWQAGASEASVLWDELAWELHDMLYGGEEE